MNVSVSGLQFQLPDFFGQLAIFFLKRRLRVTSDYKWREVYSFYVRLGIPLKNTDCRTRPSLQSQDSKNGGTDCTPEHLTFSRREQLGTFHYTNTLPCFQSTPLRRATGAYLKP